MFGFGRFACFVGSRGADCGTSDQTRLVMKPSSRDGCGMAVSLMSVLSRNAWLVLFLALSSGSASAMASEFYDSDITYYDDDNWTVAVNLARKSCFMSNVYEHRFRVLLGTDRGGGEASYDFLFVDTSWT